MKWLRKRSGLEVPAGPRLLRSWVNPGVDLEADLARAPDHVKANLGRPDGPFDPRGSAQSWEETIYSIVVDGTAVTAAANTILLPDFNFPANYLTVGKTLRYQLWGRMSSAITTPGTWIHILKWGGVGGVAMATSGAFAPDPTAAATNLSWCVDYVIVCRSVGVTGTCFTMGRMSMNDVDDATVTTIAGNLNMSVIPTATPATSVTDTTVTKALSATVTPSLGTGSIQTHMAILEALN